MLAITTALASASRTTTPTSGNTSRGKAIGKIVPPDIIKQEETPENQPVLFINKHNGVELCFFVPKGGI
jgi:hypothetical protein